MIYIYDRIVAKTERTLNYLGVDYDLKGVTRSGKSYYLTYMVPGREPILVMPMFAEQFLEAAKKFDKIRDCTTDYNARLRLKRTFRTDPYVDKYEFGRETTYNYSIDYKSIQIHMNLTESEAGGRFFLLPSFTIMKDNIFGCGEDVDIRNNELLYSYCDEE